MSVLPTKYVPLKYSGLGVASLLLSELRTNDTISSLWDRLHSSERVRTFDRFADGLTLLYTIGLVELQSGVLHRVAKAGTAP